MRAVLINHCHPDTRHICGVRLGEFAGSLAGRGHQVVLLTAPLAGQADVASAADAARLLGAHDFAASFRLAAAPSSPGLLALLRNAATPRPARQGIVLWHYLSQAGVFTDWRNGAAQYLPMLAESFEPEIIWSSFGNTDCWNIAQLLSAHAGCPWVADIKDFWSAFIARPLRARLAGRYRDAAAFTALSKSHAEDAAPWFGEDIETIYSGVAGETYSEDPANPGSRCFSLTGATGGVARLTGLKSAIKSWLESLPVQAARDLEFIYCGNDTALVGDIFADLADLCRVTVNGYVPIDQLRNIHNRAFANLYIKSERTFHHKVVELLAAGRPVICYPEEGTEAKTLAGEFGAVFHSAGNQDEIVTALGQSFERYPKTSLNKEGAAHFTWDAQAVKLEAVLLDAIKVRPKG
jgi:glycosyltransferase involved in cell wall biosynthesis